MKKSNKSIPDESQSVGASSAPVAPATSPQPETAPSPGQSETDTVLKPFCTGFDEDFQVEIVEVVNREESPHQFGHVIIDHPEWEEPAKATHENIEVKEVPVE